MHRSWFIYDRKNCSFLAIFHNTFPIWDASGAWENEQKFVTTTAKNQEKQKNIQKYNFISTHRWLLAVSIARDERLLYTQRKLFSVNIDISSNVTFASIYFSSLFLCSMRNLSQAILWLFFWNFSYSFRYLICCWFFDTWLY